MVSAIASHQSIGVDAIQIMWVEVVIGSVLCIERFTPGTKVFP